MHEWTRDFKSNHARNAVCIRQSLALLVTPDNLHNKLYLYLRIKMNATEVFKKCFFFYWFIYNFTIKFLMRANDDLSIYYYSAHSYYIILLLLYYYYHLLFIIIILLSSLSYYYYHILLEKIKDKTRKF